MKKITALALVLVMVLTVFAACNKGEAEKTTYTVKITIKNQDEVMYGPDSITLEGTTKNVPTIYDAIVYYLNENEIEFKPGELGGHSIIKSIEDATETDDMFWQFLVDNTQMKYRYDSLQIKDGNDILFFLDKDIEDTSTETEAPTEAVETAKDDYDG